jgi:hypothetical protein
MSKDLAKLKANFNGRLHLRLTPEEQSSAGITVSPAGNLQGNLVLSPGFLQLMMADRGAEVDLIRVHSLLDLVKTPDEKLNDLTNPPTVNPSSHGTPGSNGDFTAQDVNNLIVNRIAGQLQALEAGSEAQIEQRPGTQAINDCVSALELTGGPSDVTAFHDVQVLQIAFKDVWTEAFDGGLQNLAQQIYEQATQHYSDSGLQPPDGSFDDIDGLQSFINQIQSEINIDPTSSSDPQASNSAWEAYPDKLQLIPGMSRDAWSLLSNDQRRLVFYQADIINNANGTFSPADIRKAMETVAAITSHPEGAAGSLGRLMYELNQSLAERYSFDVFVPDTYNYGILLTYRQKWEPISYQVGDLVSTIPLAPGESRKYTKRRVTKETRTTKAADKSSATASKQSSDTQRAEAAIMEKVSQGTNFKTTVQGSIKVGMADFSGSTQFGMHQDQESSKNIKTLHEATMRAAEEYRKEHSLEVDTTTSVETEETYSGEISNPNNEITVTYLFYELQRRYRISEQLHRARAVILVAQEVPTPDQIDEAWLIENQWIVSRALLDESLRPALEYLSSGFAGDEVALEVLRASWQTQAKILDSLETKVIYQMNMRDALRGAIVDTTLQEDSTKAVDVNLTKGLLESIGTGLIGDPGKIASDMLDAQRKMIQSRLDYAQSDLDDLQRKLQSATDAYHKATNEYTAALQKKYSREVNIDQLRVHVKQNILHYMQAIWDHEPPDQRFFRLYHKQVICPIADTGSDTIQFSPVPSAFDVGLAGTVNVGFDPLVFPILENKVDLVEIADLDNPLGYKGNYIIFPLKSACYLTSYMLQDYVDDYFGIRDPNEAADHPLDEVSQYIAQVWKKSTEDQQAALKTLYTKMLLSTQAFSDEIVVASGQLYIEALPGRHPLLEDFKLRHRLEDVKKVQAEVRHAEMENLRLAARLVASPAQLQDPDIEKRIVVDKGVGVVMDSNP